MKFLNIAATILCTSVLSLAFSDVVKSKDNQELNEAQMLVKQFGKSLKGTLQSSLKENGPEAAIDVCNLQALPISKAISNQSGWIVGRTALKTRNAANSPDTWELNVLNEFEQRKAAGEDLKTIEYSEVVADGDNSVFRYMKAIPTSEVCLKCHGSNLADSITNKINSLYPEDKATGFNLGDIRGAFSFKKVQ